MNSTYLRIIIDESFEYLMEEEPEFARLVDHHAINKNGTTTVEILVSDKQYFFAQDDQMVEFLTAHFATISGLCANTIEVHLLAWDGENDFSVYIEPKLLGILAGLSASIIVHSIAHENPQPTASP